MTKAAGIGPLPDVLEALSGTAAVARAFGRARLPPELVSQPDCRLPVAALIRLFDCAASEAGERCLGIGVGQQMNHRSFGRWVDYATGAETLRDALRRVERCIGLFQSGASLRVRTEAIGLYWGYQRPARPDRGVQHADHVLPPMIELLREYLGRDWMPDHACVSYPRDPLGHRMEQALGTSVRFDCPDIAIRLTRPELLAPRRRPLALSDRVTFEDVLADDPDRNDGTTSWAVRQILSLRLRLGETDIERTAQLAGIAPRSLQRQLQSEGMTYRRLVEHARMQRATSLLRESEDSIANIALHLGYSEPGNFTRAFHRATGRSPVDFRRAGDQGTGNFRRVT